MCPTTEYRGRPYRFRKADCVALVVDWLDNTFSTNFNEQLYNKGVAKYRELARQGFEETIKEADRVMDYLVPSAPITTPINVLTGLKKLFSGFEKPIVNASKLYDIEYSSLIFELGNRKLVAGQEDLILEIAQKLKK